MLGTKELSEIILDSEIENLKVAPSNIGLVGIEKEFYKNTKERELVLKRKIDPIKKILIILLLIHLLLLDHYNKYIKCINICS